MKAKDQTFVAELAERMEYYTHSEIDEIVSIAEEISKSSFLTYKEMTYKLFSISQSQIPATELVEILKAI